MIETQQTKIISKGHDAGFPSYGDVYAAGKVFFSSNGQWPNISSSDMKEKIKVTLKIGVEKFNLAIENHPGHR